MRTMTSRGRERVCEWCGQSYRGHLRICEICRRIVVNRFGKKEKGVFAGRPSNPQKEPDPQPTETPSTSSAQLRKEP